MNGATAALLLDFPSATAPAPKAVPAKAEIEIGRAVAAAVVAFSQALADYETNGAMDPTTRIWGGGMLGRVCELKLAHLGEIDFSAVAHAEGRRALRQRVDFCHGVELGEAAIGELIDNVLAITNRVCADELALRAH